MNYSRIICPSLGKEDKKREYLDIVLSESIRISNIVFGLLNLLMSVNEDMVQVAVGALFLACPLKLKKDDEWG